MKSIRESTRDFNHAWADFLRILANELDATADRFDVRAWYDEGLELLEEKRSEGREDRLCCVCGAPDPNLYCEVHDA